MDSSCRVLSLAPVLCTGKLTAQKSLGLGRYILPGPALVNSLVGEGHRVTLVDVEGVARFLALAIRGSLYGTYNLTGRSMTFREFLDACKAVTRSDANFVWIPQPFLREHGLDTDVELKTFAGNFPFWRPDAKNQGLYRISSDKRVSGGLATRSFEETALDCLNDSYSGQGMERSEFLPPTKEKEVLEAWKHRAP